jgi:hypothetical protein
MLPDGVGTSATFRRPSGIAISADASFALVTGYSNNLLRKIDLATNTVTTLAGKCKWCESTDGVGTSATFYRPYGVSISSDSSFAILTETIGCLVRKVDMATKLVI